MDRRPKTRGFASVPFDTFAQYAIVWRGKVAFRNRMRPCEASDRSEFNETIAYIASAFHWISVPISPPPLKAAAAFWRNKVHGRAAGAFMKSVKVPLAVVRRTIARIVEDVDYRRLVGREPMLMPKDSGQAKYPAPRLAADRVVQK